MGNICKFTQSSFSSPISASCFVMEQNIDTMKRKQTLVKHRIFLIVQGEGRFDFDAYSVTYGQGSLLFGFAGESFCVPDAVDTAYMYIDFEGGRAEELFYRFNIGKENRSFAGFDSLIPLWKESLSCAQEANTDLVAESVILYSFSRLCSRLPEYSSIVGKIVRLTEERFRDPELSISKIALELSYNAKYLSHSFKREMRVSYSEYLRDMRIKYAASLFGEGLDSIKNVSLLAGFSDPLYFSSVFKKSIGISPREYICTVQKTSRE